MVQAFNRQAMLRGRWYQPGCYWLTKGEFEVAPSSLPDLFVLNPVLVQFYPLKSCQSVENNHDLITQHYQNEKLAQHDKEQWRCNKWESQIQVCNQFSLEKVVNQVFQKKDRWVTEGYQSIEVEEEEVLLCVEPNTIIDPWTVVVNHYNALAALATVVHVWWLEWIADEAFAFDQLVNCCVALDIYFKTSWAALLLLHKFVKHLFLAISLNIKRKPVVNRITI